MKIEYEITFIDRNNVWCDIQIRIDNECRGMVKMSLDELNLLASSHGVKTKIHPFDTFAITYKKSATKD